jgi:hypothetical protein
VILRIRTVARLKCTRVQPSAMYRVGIERAYCLSSFTGDRGRYTACNFAVSILFSWERYFPWRDDTRVTRSPQSHDEVVSGRFTRVAISRCDIALRFVRSYLCRQVDVTICIVNRRSADRPCNELAVRYASHVWLIGVITTLWGKCNTAIFRAVCAQRVNYPNRTIRFLR